MVPKGTGFGSIKGSLYFEEFCLISGCVSITWLVNSWIFETWQLQNLQTNCFLVCNLLRWAAREAWNQSHYREVPRWEIFLAHELRLRFGLDLGRLAALKKRGWSGPIMSNFWGQFFSLFWVKKRFSFFFWKHCCVRTEKLHKIKLKFFKKIFGKKFYLRKTSFFRAKNATVTT